MYQTSNNSQLICLALCWTLSFLGSMFSKAQHSCFTLRHHRGQSARYSPKTGPLRSPVKKSLVWLVGGFNPSEKYQSQLGWWHSQLNGKIEVMFQSPPTRIIKDIWMEKTNNMSNVCWRIGRFLQWPNLPSPARYRSKAPHSSRESCHCRCRPTRETSVKFAVDWGSFFVSPNWK